MAEKTLTIVIPFYNASKTIEETLMSICIQSIKNKCTTLIVDDASSQNEHNKLLKIIKKFKEYIDVDYIRYDENKGPGYARQKGLDNCKTKYITFIDADDVFAGSNALFLLCNHLDNNENCSVICGEFTEEVRNGENKYVCTNTHNNDFTWMFGKVYRMSFIEKFDISFPESRANEDSAFNGQCLICAKDNEIQFMNNTIVYCWNYNESSITKNNDYSYNGLKGYIDNHVFTIHKIYKMYLNKVEGVSIATIVRHTIRTFVMIYLYRMNLTKNGRSKEQLEQYDEWALNYFRNVYVYFSTYITRKDLEEHYFALVEKHKNLIANYILPNNIYQYISKLNNMMLDKLELLQVMDENNVLAGYIKRGSDTENIKEEDLITVTDINEYLNK